MKEKLNLEMKEKEKRVREFLNRKNLDGVLLCRQDNFSWVTCGRADQVLLGSDIGFVSLLITQDKKYAITTNIEAPRITEEEKIKEQGFELVVLNWYEYEKKFKSTVIELVNGGKLGCDTFFENTEFIKDEFAQLRYILTPEEIDRYLQLGQESAKIVQEVCKEIKIGDSERSIAAKTAEKLLEKGIFPSCLLVGTDERIFKYRHPVPTEKKLNRYAMIVVVGIREGLNIALTRSVHFGALPSEIVKKHNAVVKVDATLISKTIPGRRYSEILKEGADAYAKVGYPDEWKKHSQGGPIGYSAEGRDFDATPDNYQTVKVNQSVAWNPTITGTKSEDTFIVKENGREMITTFSGWPMIEVEIDGEIIERPDILKRD